MTLVPIFGDSPVFDNSLPIQPIRKIVGISFSIHIALHVAGNIFKVFFDGFHIRRHLKR